MINFYPSLPVGRTTETTTRLRPNTVAATDTTNSNRESHIKERRRLHNRRGRGEGRQAVDMRSGSERRRPTINIAV